MAALEPQSPAANSQIDDQTQHQTQNESPSPGKPPFFSLVLPLFDPSATEASLTPDDATDPTPVDAIISVPRSFSYAAGSVLYGYFLDGQGPCCVRVESYDYATGRHALRQLHGSKDVLTLDLAQVSQHTHTSSAPAQFIPTLSGPCTQRLMCTLPRTIDRAPS